MTRTSLIPDGLDARGAVRLGGSALFGLVAAGALSIAVMNALRGIQPPLYHAVYTEMGPTSATHVAVLGHFTLGAVIAVLVPPLVVAAAADGFGGTTDLAPGLAGTAGLLVLFALGWQFASFPFFPGLVVLGLLLLGVPLFLSHRLDVRSPALPTMAGAAPVALALFVLMGFGMVWGWGYVVVAETVSPAVVDEPPSADFDDVPAVRDDLFAANNCDTTDGTTRCELQLRGYDHERTAARFLDQHGVRCPYTNDPGGPSGSVIAEHENEYYRVTCTPHGD